MNIRALISLAILCVASGARAGNWPDVSGDLPANNLGANDAAVVVGVGDYFALPTSLAPIATPPTGTAGCKRPAAFLAPTCA